MQYVPANDCGECIGCRIRAEVVEVLEYVDAKLAPACMQAVEELHAAKRAERDRRVIDALARSASRRKEEWYLARERFLTPQVTWMAMCRRQPRSVIYVEAP